MFENVHAKRYQIADGLAIETEGRTDDEVADAIVKTVTQLCDSLNLLTRLCNLERIRCKHFPELAEAILDNYKHRRNLLDLDPTREKIIAVLEIY